jgi:hypothetical protein
LLIGRNNSGARAIAATYVFGEPSTRQFLEPVGI